MYKNNSHWVSVSWKSATGRYLIIQLSKSLHNYIGKCTNSVKKMFFKNLLMI